MTSISSTAQPQQYTNTAAATRTTNPASAETEPATASGFAGGDFNTFLTMLTTQLKHQDPLNPMEGSDFAVQLATFSGVEQQARSNQLLEQLNAQRQEGLGSVADWIGKEVRTTSQVAYTGAPLRLDIKPADGATSVELVAIDSYNREVSRQSLSARAQEISWDAIDKNGAPLTPGQYSFKLVSLYGDQILKTDAVGAYSKVTGAELTSKGIRLTLNGGASALESEVTALRAPS